MRQDLRNVVAIVSSCLVVSALYGCTAPYRPIPYVPKSQVSPKPLVCHDAIGHVRGNKPWVLGGNCCCTPTRECYSEHVAAGTLDASMSYEQYLDVYRKKGVVTDLDHKGCGNLCTRAPHVTLGGKCMATPAPGTWIYERVTFGPHTTHAPGQAAAAAREAAPGGQ